MRGIFMSINLWQLADFPYLENFFLFSTSHDLFNSFRFIMIDRWEYHIRTLPKMGSFYHVAFIIEFFHFLFQMLP